MRRQVESTEGHGNVEQLPNALHVGSQLGHGAVDPRLYGAPLLSGRALDFGSRVEPCDRAAPGDSDGHPAFRNAVVRVEERWDGDSRGEPGTATAVGWAEGSEGFANLHLDRDGYRHVEAIAVELHLEATAIDDVARHTRRADGHVSNAREAAGDFLENLALESGEARFEPDRDVGGWRVHRLGVGKFRLEAREARVAASAADVGAGRCAACTGRPRPQGREKGRAERSRAHSMVRSRTS